MTDYIRDSGQLFSASSGISHCDNVSNSYFFLTLVSTTLLGFGVVKYAARSSNGLLEVISGGPFQTRHLVESNTIWSLVNQHMTIEMQTMSPSTSRTMCVVIVDNRVFVVTSYMKSRVTRLSKKWPQGIKDDTRALIRIDGKIFPMQLSRIQKDDAINAVLLPFNQKYNRRTKAADLEKGASWLFELRPT